MIRYLFFMGGVIFNFFYLHGLYFKFLLDHQVFLTNSS